MRTIASGETSSRRESQHGRQMTAGVSFLFVAIVAMLCALGMDFHDLVFESIVHWLGFVVIFGVLLGIYRRLESILEELRKRK